MNDLTDSTDSFEVAPHLLSNPLMLVRVEQLGLSRFITGKLVREEIGYVGQLVAFYGHYHLHRSLKDFGMASCKEVKASLERLGVQLGDAVPFQDELATPNRSFSEIRKANLIAKEQKIRALFNIGDDVVAPTSTEIQNIIAANTARKLAEEAAKPVVVPTRKELQAQRVADKFTNAVQNDPELRLTKKQIARLATHVRCTLT